MTLKVNETATPHSGGPRAVQANTRTHTKYMSSIVTYGQQLPGIFSCQAND